MRPADARTSAAGSGLVPGRLRDDHRRRLGLLPLVTALATGRPPELLDTYTTTVTDVLDLGLIVPTLVVAAGLVRRRTALGHVLAAALIVLLVLIAATIIAGTVLQIRASVAFTAGQVIGPVAGFLVLGAVGVVLLGRLLRDIPAGGPPTDAS